MTSTPASRGSGKRLEGHRAAIDRDDQARSLGAEPHQRLAARPVSLEQAIGDIVPGLEAQIAQQADQQRGAGRAVDVVIAEDRHPLLRQHRLGQPVRCNVHVAEDRRIGEKLAQHRGPLLGQIFPRHAATEQQLVDDAIEMSGQAFADFHVAGAPAPGLSGKRGRDAENCRFGGHRRTLEQMRAARKSEGRAVDRTMSLGNCTDSDVLQCFTTGPACSLRPQIAPGMGSIDEFTRARFDVRPTAGGLVTVCKRQETDCGGDCRASC